MEWYLTCQRFTTYRNKKNQKKMELECVLQTCNHQITHMQHGKTKFPFKSNTLAAILGAQVGDWLHRETSILF